jgi:hypothetical protein
MADPRDRELAELRSEIERLGDVNKELLEQQELERQAFAKWKEERNYLVQYLLAEYRKEHPTEEEERQALEMLSGWEKGEGKWYTFEEIMAEVQEILDKAPLRQTNADMPERHITQIPVPGGSGRTPTGALQFQDDWPGLFIRGDDAIALSIGIHQLAKCLADHPDAAVALYRLEKIAGIIDKDIIVRKQPPGNSETRS